jgi:MFS transporter, DHA1 family, multidrug resistance protein
VTLAGSDHQMIGHSAVRLKPDSFAFTVLLGLLAALPTFGIDMILPALTATGTTLGVSPSDIGLTMSGFLLSLGTAPLVYGPVSDRFGRKPVLVFGCALLIVASIGCAAAESFRALLAWRVVQGAGAASATLAVAIVRDLFEGQAARVKMSYVVIAINVVPMIAPTIGAALLAFGGWRVIYWALAGAGGVSLLAVSLGFTESARIDPTNRLVPTVIARNYLRVLMHPICLGYILVNAAAVGTIFAYVTGSSLFLINVAGLSPSQYGVFFGTTAVAVMGGAFLSGRFSALAASRGYPLMIGLALSALSTLLLLVMTLDGWMPLPLVMSLMFGNTLAFGLITTNATDGAMQPLPQIAGSVGAASGCVRMIAAGSSSALVAVLFDGRSALPMTAMMAFFALLAGGLYILVVRPAERVALLV